MQLTLQRIAQSLVDTASDSIRPIRHSDLEELAHLYYVSYPQGTVADLEEARSEVNEAWNNEYGTWLKEASLVYVESGQIHGCIMSVDSPPWPDVADQVFIIDLFVAPHARHRGIGRALMEHALSGIEAGRTVGLRVESENEMACALYRQLGFH